MNNGPHVYYLPRLFPLIPMTNNPRHTTAIRIATPCNHVVETSVANATQGQHDTNHMYAPALSDKNDRPRANTRHRIVARSLDAKVVIFTTVAPTTLFAPSPKN
jgi:hypothetical protein